MLLELCKSAPHIMASDMCPVGERSITSSLITPIIIFIFLSWGGEGEGREQWLGLEAGGNKRVQGEEKGKKWGGGGKRSFACILSRKAS